MIPLMMLFTFAFAFTSIYQKCIQKYGKYPYLQLYDSYSPFVYGKYVKCNKWSSLMAKGMVYLIWPTKNETAVLEERLSHFAAVGISNRWVDVYDNRSTTHVKTNYYGDVHFKYNFSSQVYSLNTSANVVPVKAKLVISDIDDTLKISNITSLRKALIALLMQPLQPFQDIVPVMNRWSASNVSFAYISAGFKQSFNFIEPFIHKYFPPGPVLLRSVGLSTFMEKDGIFAFKVATILELLSTSDTCNVTLIGDSTQVDAKVYSYIYKLYPSRIDHIFIRLVHAFQAPKVKEYLKGVPHILFSNAAQLPDKL
eukprot:NODE_144_length_15804_cov_0.729131.p7 type:complete len:311 gc:universal NODE_144_length_15804_cov_0.729131:3165-4097(+)